MSFEIKTFTEMDNEGKLHIYRNGTEIPKGFKITQDWVDKNRLNIEKMCGHFTAYPDLFIDLITPSDSNFRLFFYQRIFLRACLRFRYHYCTAPRAFSKTFVSIFAEILKCVFQPGFKTFICAPGKGQGAKIAKENVEQIFDLFPLLKKELVGEDYNSGADYLKMTFRNGSIFDVVYAGNSQRGGRRHGGLIDETRDHDGDDINEIVLPLLNVNRRTKARLLNPNEPHQSQFFLTSAGGKNTWAYQKLIEVFVHSIINPRTAFVWGCTYRVPMKHGLLDRTFLNEIKMSSTYKDDSFAREYLSKWTGGGENSWFDYDRLGKYRKLINPESCQKIREDTKVFYLLSVDVGRLSCQTVVTVFKVHVTDDGYKYSVVNIYILGRKAETKHFSVQATDLKKLIRAFDPEEIVIDGNGLGVGLLDFMCKDSISPQGEKLPAYCAFNDDNYSQKLYPNAIPKLFIIKSNGALQSKIDSNCYSTVFSGRVQFLEREQIIKNKLIATKKGQKMSIESRVARVMPHELTTRLHEEMANFRLKQMPGGSDIKLEKINSKMLSDKFSSFEYGLWRLKEKEDLLQKNKKKNGRKRKLLFFN